MAFAEQVPPNLSESLSDDEKELVKDHKQIAVNVRRSMDNHTFPSDPENLHDTESHGSAAFIGSDSVGARFLAVGHLFSRFERGDDDNFEQQALPYAHAFDAIADGYVFSEEHYFAFTGNRQASEQEVAAIDAAAIRGRYDLDLAIMRASDESLADAANFPRFAISKLPPTPGQRYSVCGYPHMTNQKEQYWMTFIGTISEGQLGGHRYNPGGLKRHLFVLNPASFKNHDVRAFATNGLSGSSITGVDHKIYSVLKSSINASKYASAVENVLKAAGNDPAIAALAHSEYPIVTGPPVSPELLRPYSSALGHKTTQARLPNSKQKSSPNPYIKEDAI